MDNGETKKQVIEIEDNEVIDCEENVITNRINIICYNAIISMPKSMLKWLYETSVHFDKPQPKNDYRAKYEQLLEKYVDMTMKFANFIDKKF